MFVLSYSCSLLHAEVRVVVMMSCQSLLVSYELQSLKQRRREEEEGGEEEYARLKIRSKYDGNIHNCF